MLKDYAIAVIALLVCVALLAVLWPSAPESPEEREALAEGRVVITYWDRHSGHEHESRRELIDEFNRSQDKVYVRALSIGYNSLMEKLLTSIAGGVPPDICALDGTILAQLAAQGCFLPLDEFMGSDPYLSQDAFFPYIWDAVSQGGHVYGVPTTTDTYCLLWNKDAFRRAGLDPDRPPRSIEELESFAAQLTVQDESGIQQIGFLPWIPWDHSYKLGVIFGGTWYDPETDRMVCAEDPNILRSMQWQQSFAIDPDSDANPRHALDPQKFMSFQRNFGAYMSATNPFYTGKVAMIIEGEWQCTFIPKYAPDLNWGVAPFPAPEGVEPVAYSPTCIADCIPVGCRNEEAAFAFLRWFHRPRPDGRPSPSSDYNFAIHNIPCRPSEATQARFTDDPTFRVFVDVLMERPVATTPVTPVSQFMGDEIERYREKVVLRELTPEQALREVQDTVNAELRRTRAFLERTRP
ncbi:MAG: ABC transporter substrate-binding protein [Candidatus Hydrogenedentes bacterium]|nr:ABC transporter substrate-binding protein [Candidatus Hydrogenedentota bacterium]